jgi:hypothetical protein
VLVRRREEHRGAAFRRLLWRTLLFCDCLHEEEAREVIRVIRDVCGELDEAVALGRLRRGDCGDLRVAGLGDVTRGHTCIDRRHGASTRERGEKPTALLEYDRVGLNPREASERRSRHTEEPVVHPKDDIAHRHEIVLGDQIVTHTKRPRESVLQRKHAVAGASGEQGDGHVAKRG